MQDNTAQQSTCHRHSSETLTNVQSRANASCRKLVAICCFAKLYTKTSGMRKKKKELPKCSDILLKVARIENHVGRLHKVAEKVGYYE